MAEETKDWKESTREQDLLRTLMHTIPDQIYFKDREHRFIMLNESTAKNLGTTVADAIGKSDFDFFPEARAREYCEDEEAIMKGGKPLVGKIERTGSEGEVRWNYSNKVPILDEKGEVVGIAGINRDITERKKAEEWLAFERNLLRSLLDHTPDPVYFKDRESRFVRVSKAKAMEVGATPNEMVGKTDFDFFPKEQAEKMFEDDKRVMETKEQATNKIEKITRADGKERWVSATKAPRYDKRGNVVGTLGISRDLTEHWVLWRRTQEMAGGV